MNTRYFHCPICNGLSSEQSEECPHCGHKPGRGMGGPDMVIDWGTGKVNETVNIPERFNKMAPGLINSNDRHFIIFRAARIEEPGKNLWYKTLEPMGVITFTAGKEDLAKVEAEHRFIGTGPNQATYIKLVLEEDVKDTAQVDRAYNAIEVEVRGELAPNPSVSER